MRASQKLWIIHFQVLNLLFLFLFVFGKRRKGEVETRSDPSRQQDFYEWNSNFGNSVKEKRNFWRNRGNKLIKRTAASEKKDSCRDLQLSLLNFAKTQNCIIKSRKENIKRTLFSDKSSRRLFWANLHRWLSAVSGLRTLLVNEIVIAQFLPRSRSASCSTCYCSLPAPKKHLIKRVFLFWFFFFPASTHNWNVFPIFFGLKTNLQFVRKIERFCVVCGRLDLCHNSSRRVSSVESRESRGAFTKCWNTNNDMERGCFNDWRSRLIFCVHRAINLILIRIQKSREIAVGILGRVSMKVCVSD